MNTLLKYTLLACIAIYAVNANKVVVYWGQNSVGAESNLREYCASSSVDIVVIGFVYQFPTAPNSQYPGLNFANHCWRTFDNANPNFLNCSDSIGPDITYCQSLGKQILLSFGGAVGNYGFSSDTQAQTFASTVWNMFLGGSSPLRPFGTAIVDGIDLDIEAGGSRGYAAFVTQLRTYFTAQSARSYFISGAPQCVYPDAMMGPGVGTALGESWFDYVWVQFYNNYCGVNYYPSQFNFNVWANWAKTSKNPNVKVFIGAPGDSTSAGQGYVTANTLQIIDNAVLATFPANYGGLMLWDAGTAKRNGDFAGQLAAFVHVGGSSPVISAPPTIAPSPAPVTITPTPAPVTITPTPAPVTITPTPAPVSLTTGRVKVPSSSPVSTPVATPTPTPVTPTPVPQPAPTPVPVSTPQTSSCSDGYMKCAGTNSYQTCTRGLWAAPQTCQSGLKCSPSGNYIYCVR